MHDEPWITLDFGDVATIVVDPVAVERQRGIAKQQDVVGDEGARPHGVGGRPRGRWCRGARVWRVAIDDVVFLDDRRTALAGNFMANDDEHE
jgi:hypothetical protein